jgi:hypothetical protein
MRGTSQFDERDYSSKDSWVGLSNYCKISHPNTKIKNQHPVQHIQSYIIPINIVLILHIPMYIYLIDSEDLLLVRV